MASLLEDAHIAEAAIIVITLLFYWLAGRHRTTPEKRARAQRLGRALAHAREQAERTQESVAHEVGVAVSTVRNVEAGRSADPGVFLIAGICAVLCVDIGAVCRNAAFEAPEQD